MPTIDHNRDCVCGQPLNLVVTSMSFHCPRCGRNLAPTCPSEVDDLSRALFSTLATVAA